MKVTIERGGVFDLRNLLGYDCSPQVLETHQRFIDQSTAFWVGRADGVEACIVGLIPITVFSSKAYLWMTHSRLCEQHPLLFIRWSRKVVAEALKLYPTIIGLCHPDNESGRQWLEWLGAKFKGTYNNHNSFEITHG